MPTIKTAISIDKSLYRKVESLARKMSMSRSQVFSQAVEYMIERDESIDLIRRINAAYGDEPSGGNDPSRRAKKVFAGLVKGSW